MKNWLSTLALCLVASVGRTEEHLVVPQEALALTKAHGCEPIVDYFVTRPGAGEEAPPYAVTTDHVQKLQVAVWCTKDSSKPEGQRSYLLLVRIDESSNPMAGAQAKFGALSELAGCASPILRRT